MKPIKNTERTRKVLSIKTGENAPGNYRFELKRENSPTPVLDTSPSFVARGDAKFMVWNENGYMPKKMYDDPHLACLHAIKLSKKTGDRFHVMRSWRILVPTERGEK